MFGNPSNVRYGSLLRDTVVIRAKGKSALLVRWGKTAGITLSFGHTKLHRSTTSHVECELIKSRGQLRGHTRVGIVP